MGAAYDEAIRHLESRAPLSPQLRAAIAHAIVEMAATPMSSPLPALGNSAQLNFSPPSCIASPALFHPRKKSCGERGFGRCRAGKHDGGTVATSAAELAAGIAVVLGHL
jgi:hypothetical protein